MADTFSVFMSYVIIIGLMLLLVSVVKQLLPGPYRFVQRLGVPVMNFAVREQARRRGWLFTLCGHLPLVTGGVLILAGTMTGTWPPLLLGLGMVGVAWVAAQGFKRLHRLRRGRRRLPGRR